MAALQGAKVIGADTRCAVHNTSSESSFLRIARMTDPPDSLDLDLWMAYPTGTTGIFPVDPIDSLQTLYNLWKTTNSNREIGKIPQNVVKVYTDASGNTIFDFTLCKEYKNCYLTIVDLYGRILLSKIITSRIMKINIPTGVTKEFLVYQVIRQNHILVAKGKFVR
jgi:hypothetical protein